MVFSDVNTVMMVGCRQIGMDHELSDDTRLLYCTTGVLLQKLINDKNMHRFTHVILDEVSLTAAAYQWQKFDL